jgi:hypothetical protein
MTTERLTLSRRVLGAAAILVALCSVAFAQAPAPAAAPMTNDDVVKMAKVGFGNEVIEAKIAEAHTVDFRLEVDDLAKLKAAGVSQSVISTMLKRSSGSTQSGRAESPAVVPTNYNPSAYSDVGRVKLLTSDQRSVDLRAIGGSMSTTFAYVTTLMHANFPGEKSDVRIQDRRPTLLIKSPNSPKGHFYLVSAEADSKDGVRSVKMGNSRFFGVKNIGAPDSDNQMPYDVSPEGPNAWRLSPTKDLRPGEYGLWSSMTEMYDFGIDP